MQLQGRLAMTLTSFLAVAVSFALLHLQQAASADPVVHSYTVVADYPHDKDAFTQGLQFDRECSSSTGECFDILWESTGLYGESSIRKVVLGTGQVLQKVVLPKKWFAEGLTRVGNTLYQLTWMTGTLFKWTITEDNSIIPAGQVQGPLKDGWGLTSDGSQLIATDSSAILYFIDPDTMQIKRQLTVMDGDKQIRWLNELEVIEGELWANVWQTECIARIDMATGRVTHWVLMHGLRHQLTTHYPDHHDLDVLNGIAYDSAAKRLFVTGKKWPKLFEVIPRHNRHQTVTLEHVRQECIR